MPGESNPTLTSIVNADPGTFDATAIDRRYSLDVRSSSEKAGTGIHTSSPPSPFPSALKSPWDHAQTPRASKRRTSNQFSTSPTPNLIGSYSESLLSGRMSTPPSIPFPFEADIGVMGELDGATPRHLTLDFQARFYALPDGLAPGTRSQTTPRSLSSSHSSKRMTSPHRATGFSPSPSPSPVASPSPSASAAATQAPYVGTIDLDSHYFAALQETIDTDGSKIPPRWPGYAVPSRGHIQLLIKNPHLNTPVKLFLVPYDLTDMPTGTKTFIRQKTVLEAQTASVHSVGSSKRHSIGGSMTPPRSGSAGKETLRYAVHLQFAALPRTQTTRRTQPRKDCATCDDEDVFGLSYKSTAKARFSSSISASEEPDQPSSFEGLEPPQIILHKSIRVVFSPRAPDKEEIVRTYLETPAGLEAAAMPYLPNALDAVKLRQKKYASYSGPPDHWETLRRQARHSRKQWKQCQRDQVSADVIEDMEATGTSAMAIDIDTSSSVHPTQHEYLEPNSDPNGERWAREHEQVQEGVSDQSDMVEEALLSKWSALTFSRDTSDTKYTSLLPQATAHGVARVQKSNIAMTRQRSRTFTPTDHGGRTREVERQDQTSPSNPARYEEGTTSARPHPARSLPSAVTTRLSTAGTSQVAQAKPPSRPSSPFAAPLRISTALLPVTTNETVSGVTSPPPASLEGNTPTARSISFFQQQHPHHHHHHHQRERSSSPSIDMGRGRSSSIGRNVFESLRGSPVVPSAHRTVQPPTAAQTDSSESSP